MIYVSMSVISSFSFLLFFFKVKRLRLLLIVCPKTEFRCTFFHCYLHNPKLLCIFAPASAHIMLPNAMDQPMGGALHIRRRYWRFVFGCFETTTIELLNKDKCRVIATGCNILSVVCCEGQVSSTHTLRVFIYLNVGVSLSVFSKAVVGLEQRTGRCRHPRFLFVVGNN